MGMTLSLLIGPNPRDFRGELIFWRAGVDGRSAATASRRPVRTRRPMFRAGSGQRPDSAGSHADQAAMDARETRTHGAGVAALRTRPRTQHRAVQCGLGGHGFRLNRTIKKAPPERGRKNDGREFLFSSVYTGETFAAWRPFGP